MRSDPDTRGAVHSSHCPMLYMYIRHTGLSSLLRSCRVGNLAGHVGCSVHFVKQPHFVLASTDGEHSKRQSRSQSALAHVCTSHSIVRDQSAVPGL